MWCEEGFGSLAGGILDANIIFKRCSTETLLAVRPRKQDIYRKWVLLYVGMCTTNVHVCKAVWALIRGAAKSISDSLTIPWLEGVLAG